MKDQGTNLFMILVIAYKRPECNRDKERTRCQEFKNERISTVIFHKITVNNYYRELRSKYFVRLRSVIITENHQLQSKYFVPISRKSVYPYLPHFRSILVTFSLHACYFSFTYISVTFLLFFFYLHFFYIPITRNGSGSFGSVPAL